MRLPASSRLIPSSNPWHCHELNHAWRPKRAKTGASFIDYFAWIVHAGSEGRGAGDALLAVFVAAAAQDHPRLARQQAVLA